MSLRQPQQSRSRCQRQRNLHACGTPTGTRFGGEKSKPKTESIKRNLLPSALRYECPQRLPECLVESTLSWINAGSGNSRRGVTRGCYRELQGRSR